jgi:hypothetical protein
MWTGLPIMGSAQEYFKYAQECCRWAAEARNDKDREDLLSMAKAWTHLALSGRGTLQSACDNYAAKQSSRS